MANECVVYHKHLAGMDLTDGYIGISKDFENRMKQHHRDAFLHNSIYTVHEKMRMYGTKVITNKIFEGTRKECEQLEYELRPSWHKGWNMCIGGGSPAKEKWYSKLWLDNRIYNPTTMVEIVISPKMWISDFTAKYLPEINKRSAENNIAQMMYGRIPMFKSWELANSQLVQRVKERFYKKFERIYMKKENKIVAINNEARNLFYKEYNLPIQNNAGQILYSGSQNKKYGWSLTTEEEWLETAERVEFK